MSEQLVNGVGLSAEQQAALQRFRRRFGRVEILVFYCLFGVGVLFGLILWTSAQSISWLLWLGLGLILCAAVYPLLVFSVIKSRTGLLWHTLNAHPEVLRHPVYCLLTFIWLLLLLRGEIAGPSFVFVLVFAVLIDLLVFLGVRIEGFSQQRAQIECQRYGDRWLKLGALSFWDIFFLRIPHERA